MKKRTMTLVVFMRRVRVGTTHAQKVLRIDRRAATRDTENIKQVFALVFFIGQTIYIKWGWF